METIFDCMMSYAVKEWEKYEGDKTFSFSFWTTPSDINDKIVEELERIEGLVATYQGEA